MIRFLPVLFFFSCSVLSETYTVHCDEEVHANKRWEIDLQANTVKEIPAGFEPIHYFIVGSSKQKRVYGNTPNTVFLSLVHNYSFEKKNPSEVYEDIVKNGGEIKTLEFEPWNNKIIHISDVELITFNEDDTIVTKEGFGNVFNVTGKFLCNSPW